MGESDTESARLQKDREFVSEIDQGPIPKSGQLLFLVLGKHSYDLNPLLPTRAAAQSGIESIDLEPWRVLKALRTPRLQPS